ncbi:MULTISPECIES: tRNA pseudouridine(55) synthase TruB [Sphingobium]|uniref:tRNA pseudouridine(55) synthase TruB n=1 Tax=Sphingobium TaxID=165695 RepID=UPI00159C8C54|nr:tRNA pseudouridine(55) synthase TruB [Sphingobium sp. 15-1]
MHGWIILDKPHGLGSTQAVSAVKRALRQSGAGKWKVGHGGTLDPLATGVLPVAIGEATKLAGRMLDSDKIYDFTIGFGVQTDTLDLEGKEIATSDHRPTLSDVEAILPRFTGPIEQAPPAYSAILIDGQRAYDLARKGEEVEMKRRSVTIHDLTLSSPQGLAKPGEEDGRAEINEITLRAHVSKGTYIRSLARDIALALGTVGHVTMLRRVKAGPFTLESAISLDKLDEAARGGGFGGLMLPLTAGLDDIPALAVSPDEALALRQGKVLVGKPHTGLMLAMEGDVPVALVESSGPETLREIRVVRGFNL